jgi:hypothetical protein
MTVRIRKFWDYLGSYKIVRFLSNPVRYANNKEVKKKTPRQEKIWLTFKLWLIKAVSMRRENKIPGLSNRKAVAQKRKLPKAGVIFVFK